MEDSNSIAAAEICKTCENVGLLDGEDGFFYCPVCGCQAQDMVDAAIPDENFVCGNGRPSLYSARHSRRVFPPKPHPTTVKSAADEFRLYSGSGLSLIDYCDKVRMSYVHGLQLMINLQCEALVEKFNVQPLVCGIFGTIWFRFLRSTRVFDPQWTNEVHLLHRSQIQGDKKMDTENPMYVCHNTFDKRMVLQWYRALRKRLPLSCSVAISYLCCHVAREPVLSTDIERWRLEGKLPYLAAFVEIGKTIEFTRECPLTADRMFRPKDIVPWNKLISSAAEIAQSVGLKLPSVNFYGIASRYLKYLSLPAEKILPYACCIHDWSVPPGLWLSTSEGMLPPRVIVMAILIIAIRILYNLNGLGKWEASLSDDSHVADDTPSAVHKLEHEASEILRSLQSKCVDVREGCGNQLINETPCSWSWSWIWSWSCSCVSSNFTSLIIQFFALKCMCVDPSCYSVTDHSKDLPTYLRYCKDVVFAPSPEDSMEGKLIKKLWEFYLNSLKDSEACESSTSKNKKVDVSGMSIERGVSWVKQHMEENRFCYIPPRKKNKNKNAKADGYLEYTRKREDGMLTYPVHADYYILLYACAREARVDARTMHHAVMSLEKTLSQIEHRVDAIFT